MLNVRKRLNSDVNKCLSKPELYPKTIMYLLIDLHIVYDDMKYVLLSQGGRI